MKIFRIKKIKVKLYEHFVTQNHIYIFMEFCNGGTLEQYLKGKGILSEGESVLFLKQICNAYSTLHKFKIVHRDLKPANILLHNGAFKVADFGFSKVLEKCSTQTKVGSPLFMSPQLLAGIPASDKCDIWSIGVILFHMLYGQFPFTGKNIIELYKMVTTRELKLPEKPVRSQKIKGLLIKMLAREEKDRISWEELLASDLVILK